MNSEYSIKRDLSVSISSNNYSGVSSPERNSFAAFSCFIASKNSSLLTLPSLSTSISWKYFPSCFASEDLMSVFDMNDKIARSKRPVFVICYSPFLIFSFRSISSFKSTDLIQASPLFSSSASSSCAVGL